MSVIRRLLGCMSSRSDECYKRRNLRFGVRLENTCNGENLPEPLGDIIRHLAKYCLDSPNLFRRPGNKADLKVIAKNLQKGRRIALKEYNAYALASVLKKFLMKLPEGLFEKEGEQRLIGTNKLKDNVREQLAAIRAVIVSLALCRQRLATLLFGLWHMIANNAAKNSMYSITIAKSVAGSMFPNCSLGAEDIELIAQVIQVCIDYFNDTEHSPMGADNVKYFRKEMRLRQSLLAGGLRQSLCLKGIEGDESLLDGEVPSRSNSNRSLPPRKVFPVRFGKQKNQAQTALVTNADAAFPSDESGRGTADPLSSTDWTLTLTPNQMSMCSLDLLDSERRESIEKPLLVAHTSASRWATPDNRAVERVKKMSRETSPPRALVHAGSKDSGVGKCETKVPLELRLETAHQMVNQVALVRYEEMRRSQLKRLRNRTVWFTGTGGDLSGSGPTFPMATATLHRGAGARVAPLSSSALPGAWRPGSCFAFAAHPVGATLPRDISLPVDARFAKHCHASSSPLDTPLLSRRLDSESSSVVFSDDRPSGDNGLLSSLGTLSSSDATGASPTRLRPETVVVQRSTHGVRRSSNDTRSTSAIDEDATELDSAVELSKLTLRQFMRSADDGIC